MTVTTQDARANGVAAATEALAREGNVVGLHWFQLYDHPKGGRADGEDYNFGLLDVYDDPTNRSWPVFVGSTIGTRAPQRKDSAFNCARRYLPAVRGDRRSGRRTRRLAQGCCMISMQSAPDEPIFGDVYLSWDDDALNVAVIAMDYYDPHLMAWTGTFPREEAFRLDLGVRQRGQARSVQLRVIPKYGRSTRASSSST